MEEKIYKELLKDITEYDYIFLFHHTYPDFDALGAQYALYYWINKNFADKKVFNINSDPRILPKKFIDLYIASTGNPVLDNLDEKVLAIVCDTHDLNRTDGIDFYLANIDKLIIIDHHILSIDPYNQKFKVNYMLHEPGASSTCEIVTDFLLYNQKNYNFPHHAMKCLFIGMVTDTGRFMYPNTTIHMHELILFFLKNNLPSIEIYDELYSVELSLLKLQGHIINNLEIFNKHIAYFILTDDILEKYDVEYKIGKTLVNTFQSIIGVKIWLLITYDKEFKQYSVSIRSRDVAVNNVAVKYKGGGHKFASGCKLKTKSEIDGLISDLDKEINKND